MKIEERTEELLKPIIEKESKTPDEEGNTYPYEIVDVEYVREGSDWYLRAYIDKEGGIKINDCERISRALEAVLDQEDFIKDAYILEVSSPGLGRAIRKDKDYVRNEGKEIELRLYKPFEHEKEWRGVLTGWNADSVTITVEDDREIVFARKDLALVREAFDW